MEKVMHQLERSTILRDALRYRRLRILGAALGGSPHAEQGTVLRFTSLDAMVDEDIQMHRTRGEVTETSESHGSGEVIDRKFIILAFNPVNGKVYDETNSLLLCAKDAAVPAALSTYREECERIGANPEHTHSVELLRQRVVAFQLNAGGGRVPDTIGAEIPRCIFGEGTE